MSDTEDRSSQQIEKLREMSDIRSAIVTLFTVSNNELITLANRYLLEVTENPGTFPTLLDVLTVEGDFRVAHFCANMLHNKARKQWHQLSAAEQAVSVDKLFQLLQATQGIIEQPQFKAFCERIMFALSAICLKSHAVLQSYLETAASLVQSDSSSVSFLISLEMLRVLSEEIESTDMNRLVRTEFESRIENSLRVVLDRCETVLELSALSVVRKSALLRLVAVYCSSQGVSLAKFAHRAPRLLQLVVDGLFSTSSESVRDSHAAMRSLLTTSEYPRSAVALMSKTELAIYLCSALTSLHQQYRVKDSLSEHEQFMLRENIQTVLVLLSGELDTLFAGDAPLQSLFLVLIDVLSLRPRSLFMLTLDFWVDLEDADASQWQHYSDAAFPHLPPPTFLEAHVLPRLLSVVLHLCAFGESVRNCESWEESLLTDEQEDLLTLRDSRLGMQELLIYCCEKLSLRFFPLLEETIAAYETNPSQWFVLEAVLFVLCNVSDMCRALYVATVSNPQLNQTIRGFLLHVAQLSLRAQTQRSQDSQLLCESTAQYLGSITFLLSEAGEPTRSIYAISLEKILQLSMSDSRLGRETVATTSAKAFHKLALHGLREASRADSSSGAQSALSLLLNCIELFSQELRAAAPSALLCKREAALFVVVETLTRSVFLCTADSTQQSELLVRIGSPLVTFMMPVGEFLSNVTLESARTLRLYLLLISQLVRFCDVNAHSQNHSLRPLLAQMWPNVEVIACSFSDFKWAALPAHVVIDIGAAVSSLLTRVLAALGVAATDGETIFVCEFLCNSVLTRRSFSSAAINSAAKLLDFLLNSVREPLRTQLLSTMSLTLSQSIAKYSPVNLEAADELFQYWYLLLLSHWRDTAIGLTEGIRDMLSLSTAVLQASSEKDPLRSLCSFVQSLFCAPAHVTQHLAVNERDHREILERKHLCAVVSEEESHQLLSLLLRLVLFPDISLQSGVASNLTDAVIAVLSWLRNIDRDGICLQALQSVFAVSLVSVAESRRERAIKSLMVLSVAQQRRCKALLLDLNKISCHLSDEDVLSAYDDAAL